MTISYDLSGNVGDIVQRIDKSYSLSEFWYFGRPQLDPVNASIVTRSGSDGFSCYVQGNEGIYTPPQYPTGYVDGKSYPWTQSIPLLLISTEVRV